MSPNLIYSPLHRFFVWVGHLSARRTVHGLDDVRRRPFCLRPRVGLGAEDVQAANSAASHAGRTHAAEGMGATRSPNPLLRLVCSSLPLACLFGTDLVFICFLSNICFAAPLTVLWLLWRLENWTP